MIAFNINGEILSADDASSLSIELINPLFIDNEVFPGSYTFPFNIELDNDTNRILNYPSRQDTFKNYPNFENVVLLIDGKPLYIGKFYVIEADEKLAKCSFIVNEFEKLKDKKISELNLGLLPDFSTNQEVLDYMLQTILQPVNHPISFFPVFNPDYFDESDRVATLNSDEQWYYERTQNYWTIDQSLYNNRFKYDPDSCIAVTPFVKAKLIWDKIFEEFGYNKIDNFFPVNVELERLYMYSNKSMNTVNTNGNNTLIDCEKNIAYYLPDMKCIDFIKQVRNTFFLGIMPNSFRKNVTITPLKDILSSSVKKDWSDKILVNPINYNVNSLHKSYGYDVSSYSQVSDKLTSGDFPYVIEVNANYSEPIFNNPFSPGYYSLKFLTIISSFNAAKDSYISKLSSLLNVFPGLWKNFFGALSYHYPNVPFIYQRGDISFKFGTDDKKEYKTKLDKTHLLFYRGIYDGNRSWVENSDPVWYPYATAGEHGPETTTGYIELPDEYSLLWNGTKGLFEKWAKEYVGILEKQKGIKCNLDLNLVDLLNYRFDDKIKIRSNNYLMKTMRISITKNGIQPTFGTFLRVN